MLFQILWALEALATEIALVGLERDVDADMGGNVIAFHRSRTAAAPTASEAEVVCGLASHMTLADVFLAIHIRPRSKALRRGKVGEFEATVGKSERKQGSFRDCLT